MSKAGKIVVNASPLIVLFKAELEHIFPDLFDEIVVPEIVIKEINVGADIVSEKIKNIDWLKIVKVKLNEDVIGWNLGKGESAVLSYALTNKNVKAVVDDKAARKCAKTNSIKILGTGSLLVLAAKKGLINDFDETIFNIKKAGFWISEYIIKLLKSRL